jgi:hypothetical protein
LSLTLSPMAGACCPSLPFLDDIAKQGQNLKIRKICYSWARNVLLLVKLFIGFMNKNRHYIICTTEKKQKRSGV